MITVAYSLFYVSDQNEQQINLILNFAVSYEEWKINENWEYPIILLNDWLSSNELIGLNDEFNQNDYSDLDWEIMKC